MVQERDDRTEFRFDGGEQFPKEFERKSSERNDEGGEQMARDDEPSAERSAEQGSQLQQRRAEADENCHEDQAIANADGAGAEQIVAVSIDLFLQRDGGVAQCCDVLAKERRKCKRLL